MTASLTNPTVSALLTSYGAVLTGELASWRLLDGWDTRQAFLARSLTVGGRWDPDGGEFTPQESVRVDLVESGAGRRVTETTEVDCLAYAGSGGSEMAPHRAAVNELVAALRSATRSLSSVDGVSARAQVGGLQWLQVADENGTGVMAAFTVQVVALP